MAEFAEKSFVLSREHTKEEKKNLHKRWKKRKIEKLRQERKEERKKKRETKQSDRRSANVLAGDLNMESKVIHLDDDGIVKSVIIGDCAIDYVVQEREQQQTGSKELSTGERNAIDITATGAQDKERRQISESHITIAVGQQSGVVTSECTSQKQQITSGIRNKGVQSNLDRTRRQSRGMQMVQMARSKQIGKPQLEIASVSKGTVQKKITKVVSRVGPSYTPSTEKLPSPGKIREVNPALISVMSDQPIGSGTYGHCFLASYRNIKVVAKEMRLLNKSRKEKERARREVVHEANVLHELGDHPGLPLLFGICSLKEPFTLVIQFHGAESESLTLLKAAKKKMLNREQLISIFCGIANALQYIHSKGYLHNDIKANNVLLECQQSEYRPIVIDFGKSKLITEGESRKRNREFDYLAPEVLEGDKETVASDVYSFGRLLKISVNKRSFRLPFQALAADMTTTMPEERLSIADFTTRLQDL